MLLGSVLGGDKRLSHGSCLLRVWDVMSGVLEKNSRYLPSGLWEHIIAQRCVYFYIYIYIYIMCTYMYITILYNMYMYIQARCDKGFS